MINFRINPMYILLLFITLSAISFFKLNDSSQSFESELEFFSEFKQDSKLYQKLKDNKASLRELDRFLRRFDNKDVKKREFKNKVSIVVKSTDINKLNNFLNQLFNSSLKIKKLVIEKESISVEIIK